MLDEQLISNEVCSALKEDIGTGDVTALILPARQWTKATITSKEAMLVCGKAWVNSAFKQLDPSTSIEWFVEDGDWLDDATVLCEITGPSRAILTAERTALNFLQTLSGTATQTYHFVSLISPYQARLLDTRKTLPGMRMAQKYAVTCAGGYNHRQGLFDAYLIKENHIKSAGSITQAVKFARDLHPEVFLEVEVESINELKEALAVKPDRIMLDNFDISTIKQAVSLSEPYQIPLEASGGIDENTIVDIAKTGVHYISLGAITKSVRAIDLSLIIRSCDDNF